MGVTRYYLLNKELNMDELLQYLNHQFAPMGYDFGVQPVGEAITVSIARHLGGFHMITGLGEKATTTIKVQDGYLYVTIGDEYWTDKIVAGIVGFFCLWFLWITCGIGIYRQNTLPKTIDQHICTFLTGYGIANPYGAPPPYGPQGGAFYTPNQPYPPPPPPPPYYDPNNDQRPPN